MIEGPGTLIVEGERNSNSTLIDLGKLTMKNACKIDVTSVYKESGILSSAILANYLDMEKDCVIKAASEDYAVTLNGEDGYCGVIEGTVIASSNLKSEYQCAFNVGSFTLGKGLKVYQGNSEAKAKLMGYKPGKIYIGEGYYKYNAILPEGSAPAIQAEEPEVAKAAISSVKSGSTGTAVITWKKQRDVSGYEIYYSTKKTGTYKKETTISKAATVKYTKKKLTSGETFYFKIKAYKLVDRKKIYGKFSAVKEIKVK